MKRRWLLLAFSASLTTAGLVALEARATALSAPSPAASNAKNLSSGGGCEEDSLVRMGTLDAGDLSCGGYPEAQCSGGYREY